MLLKYTLTTRRAKAAFQTKQNRESRTEQIKTKQKTCKQKGYCLIKKKQTDKQTNRYTNQKDPRAGTRRKTQLPVYKLGERTVIRVALRSEYIQFNSVSFSGLFNSVRMKGLF